MKKLLIGCGLSLIMFAGDAHAINLQEFMTMFEPAARSCMNATASSYLMVTINMNAVIEKEITKCWQIYNTPLQALWITQQELADYLVPIAIQELNKARYASTKQTQPQQSMGQPTNINPEMPTRQLGNPISKQDQEFVRGLQDRANWEQWFNNLQGDYKTGAFYWSSQRSLSQPGSCNQLNIDFLEGCTDAKTRLTPTDIARKTSPAYRFGWNNYTETVR
jgi:hypothetical protein